MSAGGLASWAVLIFSGIELQVDARPDPCGLVRHLRTSLLNISRVAVASPARWSVHVRADAETIVLRVENRIRSAWMVRRFPHRLTACEAVADAFALVVSRLIRNLEDVVPGLPRSGSSGGARVRTSTRSAPSFEMLPEEMMGRRRPAVSVLMERTEPLRNAPPPPPGLPGVRTSGSRPMAPLRVSIRSPALRAVRSRAGTSTVGLPLRLCGGGWLGAERLGASLVGEVGARVDPVRGRGVQVRPGLGFLAWRLTGLPATADGRC